MRKTLILIFLLMMPFLIFAVEEIILKDGIEISNQMEKDDVFFKRCMDLDTDGKYLYFIALTKGTVFKVELETGKFVQTIGSRGQGPGELSFAVNMAVKNNKVFVVDQGFRGIKIFTTDGKLINELKTGKVVRKIGIEVDNKDDIYLGELDLEGNSMVTVYDMKGNKIKSLIKHNLAPEDRNNVRLHEYRMDMDIKGNIYILFPVIQVIRKYTNDGKLVWENEINNKLLGKKYEPGKYYYKGKAATYLSRGIADFEIMDNFNIIISHSKGGCILDKEGKLKKLIITEPGLIPYLDLIKSVDAKLINISNYKKNVIVFNIELHEKIKRKNAFPYVYLPLRFARHFDFTTRYSISARDCQVFIVSLLVYLPL